MCLTDTHLHASFVQRSGPVSDPGASFQRGSHEGVMLPALELPEGAEIRVAVVQAHLEEQGDNNEPSSLLVNVAMHPPPPEPVSQCIYCFYCLERIIGIDMDKGKKILVFYCLLLAKSFTESKTECTSERTVRPLG